MRDNPSGWRGDHIYRNPIGVQDSRGGLKREPGSSREGNIREEEIQMEKQTAGVPAGQTEARARGVCGRLWGTAYAGSGVSGGRLLSSDDASTVNMKRRLEKHMPRQCPSLWRGRLPLSWSVGQALLAHDSLPSTEAAAACSASSFSG